MIDYDSKDWLRLVLTMRGSVVPRLTPRLVFVAIVGAVAVWAYDARGIKIPTIAHQLIGVALGLLLVFRTNASYDRYWEGRRLFGAITNRSRDLARQLRAFLPSEEHRAVRRDVAHLVVLFYATILQSVRKERDLSLIASKLEGDERAKLEPMSHRPTLVASWIAARIDALVRAGAVTDVQRMMLDSNVTVILESLGGAERIVKTPVPFAYAQHIKIFVLLFVFTAPFAMSESMRLYTPLASAILAFALFGIDEIGVEIEDPFGTDANDLPLEAIGATIESNVNDVLNA
ncbi:MAG: bestrophin family protein [Polyangiales bacterium]